MISRLKSIPVSELRIIGILALYLAVLGVLARFLPVQEWVKTVKDAGLWFMLGFWLLFVVRGFFLFPPLYFLLAAILIYDVSWAVTVFLVGVSLSASISYWLGRKTGGKAGSAKGEDVVRDYGMIYGKMRKHGYKTIFVLHSLGLNFDIPNYLAGHFRLRFPVYFLLVVGVNFCTTLFFALVIHPFQHMVTGG